ncbi:MAG: DNA topoisomerase IV subunit A [Acholeplasmatales bacterium]|nr:DNA topoisomerase IV subunit A [Acholeplasmatales bacterium]
MAKQETLKKKLDIFLAEKFEELKLEEALGDRFGRYSKYIIQERAIPDIRDGLKPVQRRILYGMNALKVTANAPYKKSARIVGEVMGKYHPHGDSSIYEALVRMSQKWKMGVPLIDMHGNNGSIDGDGPAAMRYTEIRLSKNSEYLLEDIEKQTVPFVPNFDDEEVEPTVLPSRFPNLLVNGSMGISSGYATYIPTHNINEVINATIERINNPNMTVDDLLEIMPGPDFPTGGIVMGRDAIREAFLTGSGSVCVRSKYEIEDMNKDGQKRIVITEIPYDIFKSQTVKKMEQLRMDGKVPDVIEVRDESGRDGLRIAIDLKKDANVDAIINFFFKNTELQTNCNYNMVAICNKRPMKLGVLPILDAYIEHQKDVVTNRTNFDLKKAKKRLHIVEGLIKMLDVTDEVIAIIRHSKNKQDSIDNLVKEFEFSPEQAEAIVMMRLYSLSHQDIMALQEENVTLNNNILEYNKILSSEKELLKVIKHELSEVNKNLVVPRRTQIEDEVQSIKIDETDLVSKEQTMVSVSKEGYLKRANLKAFNAAKSNGLKENDSILFLKEVSTLDTLLIFTNLGNFIYLPVFKIPEAKFKEVGTFISTLVSTSANEKFVAVFSISNFNEPYSLVLATKKGIMKQTLLSGFQLQRYIKPVRAMKCNDDELVSVDMIKDPLEIMVFTKNAEALRFRATDISLYGTNAGGVKSINLKNGDEVVSVIYCNKNDDFLLLTNRSTIKRMKVTDVLLTKRSRAGNPVIKKLKSNPYLLIDAKKMTPNQYKENVKVFLMYKNGNDSIDAFNLKYNVSDAGKQITPEDNTLKELVGMVLPEPSKPDDVVSPEYLVEVKHDLFTDDFGIEEETPIVTAKKASSQGIFDELDAILAKETGKKIDDSIDESENEEKKEIKYKKISLFDEE